MKFLKIIPIISTCIFLSSCGCSSHGNEAIGQVKKAENQTPLVCMNYHDVDISLGVMRNGVGSMSTQDKWFYVENNSDYELLKNASMTGQLVDIVYKTKRVNFCVENDEITSVKLVANENK